MNEEYLWDKSGEPDPEIQHLEDILGGLRYQPIPLELPTDVQPDRRNRYVPLLAIAATLLIALLAGVVWLRLQSHAPEQKLEAKSDQPSVPSSSPSPEIVVPEGQENVVQQSTQPRRRELVASNVRHRSKSNVVSNKEALLAKEQLMSALRIASEKLNLAQRKAQGPTPNQIRNQHKIG
ncbi:MAG TPA: hypothetical protein VIK24_14455 [Pyrinomonadaceae bacterium]|jgi:uncharacterized membrane protein